MNDSPGSRAAAERAVSLSPGTAQAHLAKANSLLGADRDKEALAELEAAAKCDPQNAEIEVEMGDLCWRNLHAPEQALQHYRSATNLNFVLPAAYARLSEFYIAQGETNAARSVLRILGRIAPRYPERRALEEHVAVPAEGSPGQR